jgi:hypothetical protein
MLHLAHYHPIIWIRSLTIKPTGQSLRTGKATKGGDRRKKKFFTEHASSSGKRVSVHISALCLLRKYGFTWLKLCFLNFSPPLPQGHILLKAVIEYNDTYPPGGEPGTALQRETAHKEPEKSCM